MEQKTQRHPQDDDDEGPGRPQTILNPHQHRIPFSKFMQVVSSLCSDQHLSHKELLKTVLSDLTE